VWRAILETSSKFSCRWIIAKSLFFPISIII